MTGSPMFAVRPKHTYSDPERYGYPPEHCETHAKGIGPFHNCPSCWASAPSGEPITHKPDCPRAAEELAT